MNIFEKLLETDAEKISKREGKKVEVNRLTALLGEPFVVECRPLNSEQFEHIGEISKTNADIRENVVLEGCTIEGKKFNCKELLHKFQAVTGRDVLNKLFLIGELSVLYDNVNKISGYNNDTVTEIKN